MHEDEAEILDVMQKAIERANIDFPGIEEGRPRDLIRHSSEESRHLAVVALNGLHRAGFKIVRMGGETDRT